MTGSVLCSDELSEDIGTEETLAVLVELLMSELLEVGAPIVVDVVVDVLETVVLCVCEEFSPDEICTGPESFFAHPESTVSDRIMDIMSFLLISNISLGMTDHRFTTHYNAKTKKCQ